MKILLKILSTTVVAIILLVLSVLAILLLASDETRKQWLVAGAGYAMGREVTIGGEVYLDFGSTFVLRAAKISVANTEWGIHPFLFRAHRLDASVSIWRLLRGVLDFSLSLSRPELMLETSESGAGNWYFGETAGESADSGLSLTIVPREIMVSDGRFFYRKQAVKTLDEAEIKHLYLAVHEKQRVFELDGRFNELPLTLKSERSVGETPDTETATILSVKGQLGRLNIQAEGSVLGSVESGNPELDLAIAFDSPSLRIVSGQLGQLLPDIGPLEGKARLHGSMSAPALEDVAAVVDSAKGKLRVSGVIGNVVHMSGFDMKLDAETSNLVELLKVFSVDFQIALQHRMQAEARLTGDWPTLMLGAIKANVTDGIYNAVMTGQISDLPAFDGVDFRGKVNAPTLADLPAHRHFNNDRLPRIGPVKGTVQIIANDGVWSAPEARIDVENDSGRIRFRAGIENLAKFSGLDAELQANLASLENLQMDLPPGAAELGPVDFSCVLKEEPAGSGNLVFRGQATSAKLRLIATGNARELFTDHGVALDVDLAADHLSDVGNLLGQTLSGVGPVQYNGRLVIEGNMIKLEQFEARIGSSDLAGHLAFSIADESESKDEILGGRLTSDTLDLRELILERKAVEITVLEKQKMIETSAAASTSPAKLFSTDPLPLELLRQFRTRIELNADRVITRQIILDELKMVFSLVDGLLAVHPFSAQIDGKPFELEMELDASRSPATFKFSTHGDDISITHARSTVTELGLEGGKVFYHVDVHGAGESIAAIMSDLDGSLAFAITDTRLTNVLINKFGVSLLDQINPMSKKGDPNVLECSAVYFEIEKGVATTPRGLAIQFEDVTWLGNGEIDLATEGILISARPKPRKGLGISLNQLAKLILLGGTLAKPVMQINPVGVVGASASYAAAISTGGLSLLLVGLLEKSQANERVCLRIMTPQSEERAIKADAPKRATRTFKGKPSAMESAPSELLNGDD